ncbi:MAG: hypothetical protein AAB480_00665 [Patescibacteria group bacterium]
MVKKIVSFFDKLEDRIRIRLSHSPILYATIGGIGIVLFWKGVWETAEMIPYLHGIGSVVLGTVILLITGLMVSFFIGESIIISGFKKEKKLVEKTEAEVAMERLSMDYVVSELDHIEKELDELKKGNDHTHRKIPL